MSVISTLISFVFHPVWMVTYMMLLLLAAVPEWFSYSDPRRKIFVILTVFFLTAVFPIIGMALMKLQGLVKTFQMKEKKERIAPLIFSGVFYLWLYINIRQNPGIPPALIYFVLGSVISLFLALFINNFSKVSLHTIGIGGLLTGVFLFTFFIGYGSLGISFPLLNKTFIITSEMTLIFCTLVAGLVGTARLYSRAHQEDEIYGGYLTGILSQLIAFLIVY